ncbi:hypothetical protein BDN70DRAFT_988226 [Pholiota conissans]|uniref:Uncharacterized protein n=1 Tax=Pholiota conissans TaxID=109636 RepID=A0A9P5ZDU2_9AGAR|nr:hypothetical protein BDN70DRAFT_988226 [Pholiota conissans]
MDIDALSAPLFGLQVVHGNTSGDTSILGLAYSTEQNPSQMSPGSEDLLDQDLEISEDFLRGANEKLTRLHPPGTNIDSESTSELMGTEIEDEINKYPDIINICQEAIAKSNFKNTFQLRPFKTPKTPTRETPLIKSSCIANELSWQGLYKGDAADALWTFLVNSMQPDGNAFHFDRTGGRIPRDDSYAHFAAIVRSSGMGKSRAVDEMAKTHFVIPINIRSPESSGYPPSDTNVQGFLCTPEDGRNRAYWKCKAFLLALIEMTADVVSGEAYTGRCVKDGQTYEESFTFDRHSDDTIKRISANFRKHMSDGMTFTSHGKKRECFFDAVVRKANEFLSGWAWSQTTLPKDSHERRFIKLAKAIAGDNHNGGICENDGPLVVIMFDEAHTLAVPKTGSQSSDDSEFRSVFMTMRQCLHDYRQSSLFTLFLSTTGKLDQFVSPKFAPDFGFDYFVSKLKFDGNDDLEFVVSNKHIACYGRPLWGSILASQAQETSVIKDEIVGYAAIKLLGSKSTEYSPGQPLNIHQKLACLSQRLPIEFNSTSYIAQQHQLQQMEGHMHVCLKVDGRFDSIVTNSPSEPLLSEAVYYVMESSGFDVALTLRAVGPPNRFSPKTLWCLVTDLLSNLFCDSETILTAKGQYISSKKPTTLSGKLRDTFSDGKVYFSHFIKVHQQDCIGRDSLVEFLTRGAAILYASTHPGVDIVIPVLLTGTCLEVRRMSAILVQVNNNASHSTINHNLFKQMDPYHAKVFDKACNIPVIRIVFSLAAKTSFLTIPELDISINNKLGENYKTYDIWAAGLSSKVFRAITENNQNIWTALLDASYSWKDTHTETSREELRLRKTEKPGTAMEDDYWSNWCY